MKSSNWQGLIPGGLKVASQVTLNLKKHLKMISLHSGRTVEARATQGPKVKIKRKAI